MTKYRQEEAREWALQNLTGVIGCLHPTFSSDLLRLNEAAIRHDVAMEIECGMDGMLLVSECGTTPDELRLFTELAIDAAEGKLLTVAHAALPTLQQNIDLVKHAEAAGVDLVLVSYPLTFYPTTSDEIVEYTARLAAETNLGMIVFAMHLWNFGRLHPSDFDPDLIGRLIAEVPNVVAVKNEIGAPGVAGIAQVFQRYRDEVVVTDPMEMNAPAWCATYGMRLLATSNYESMGNGVPRYFRLLQEGAVEQAMEIYWQLHPIRQADAAVIGEAVRGTALVPRLLWKYQAWLNGFNGGPIRSPHMRVSDRQMSALRQAAQAGGLDVTEDPDKNFLVGRNPS